MPLIQTVGGTGTGTSFALAYGSAVTAANWLGAGERQASAVTCTCADSVNAGNWSGGTGNFQQDNGGGRNNMFYRENTGAGTPTVTLSLGASSTVFLTLTEFSTVNTSASLDQSLGGATGTGTALASANETTTSANELLFGVMSAAATSTFTQSGSWLIPSGTGQPTARETVVYQEVTATSTYAAAVTIDASRAWIALFATFIQTVASTASPKRRALLGAGR